MDLEKIRITPEAFGKVCDLLNTNFGDIDLKSLSDHDLHYFVATCIEAAYKIGLIDGLETLKTQS